MKAISSGRLLWIAAGALLLILPGGMVGQEEDTNLETATWTQAETRLANHYISLLQRDPAYGKVFELLWGLYEKYDQTPLLIDYFGGAAEKGGIVATVVHAHLLRKSGDNEAARDAYSKALDLDGENPHALRALAEINDRDGRHAKALSLYNRLVEVLPGEGEDDIAILLRKAELHQMLGQVPEAVAIWEELLRSHPENHALRSRIVARLIESGETESARVVLSEMAESADPRARMEALAELTRINELLSDFEGSRDAAVRALTLLHFRNSEYSEIFSQLVQIHERFDKLPELEQEIRGAAEGENPTERSLHDLAEFYRLTADPTGEEEALARLVARLPEDLDYRLRLTRVQMRNDRYEDAAETLEAAFAGQEAIPLNLLLLRAQIALRADNRTEAIAIVDAALERESMTEDELRTVIDFARENYLDSIVVRILSGDSSEEGRGAALAAPIELARFLHERGRDSQARETLDSYVEAAGEATNEKARRLHQVAVAYGDLDDPVRALAAIDEALLLDPGRPDYATTRADLLVDADKVEEAIEQLETIWPAGETYAARSDIDQRLFSLLRGHYSTEPELEEDLSILKNGNIQSLAQYRRLAAAASRVGRAGDEPPPAELLVYYEDIKKAANETATTPLRYRAAWWAFKLQDNQECYEQLMKATAEAGGPMLETEQMLLELAEQNERPTLMVKHLGALAEIDPDNADDYLQRRAEMRFELGFEDEAVRELNRLAAKPEASLNTLATLAKVYQRQGSSGKQVDVWRRAYRDANVFEKRRIVRQLATALIENGKPEEALEAQLDLIEQETDPIQRRKQLDAQLTTARSHFLLDWLRDRYADLTQRHPFDRFFPEALARVHITSGNEAEAFEQMKKAYYMSGQEEGLLHELARIADEIGDLRSAIYYRRQLLVREEEDDLENWKTLIEMLEKDLQVAEAERLRRRLEGKFGRDPDFLSELAATYLENGQPAAAHRALEKVLLLREWDHESRFRLAQLLASRGEPEAALGHLDVLLEETSATPYPEEFAEDALPLISAVTLPSEARLASGGEMDPFVFSVEELPYLGGGLQDELAEKFQSSHPEHAWSPEGEPALRLRALEEAASLAARLGRGEEWSRPHLEKDRPLVERLWVARHTGNRRVLLHLLDEREWDESHFDLLCSAYLRLLCRDEEALEEWAQPDRARDEGRHPRSRYAVIAAYLLLKDVPSDPLVDDSWIRDWLAAASVHPKVGEHIFSEFRKVGRYDEAFRIGQGWADGPLSDEGGYLFALSQVAGWAGYPDQRRDLLHRSLELLEAGSRTRGDGYFFTALTEMLSVLEDDLEGRRFLAEFAADSEEGTYATPSDRLERQLLVAIAGGQETEAIELLGALVTRQMNVIRPRSSDLDQVRFDQIQSWQRMSQLLRYYVERIPARDASSRRALFEALGGNLAAIPRDESVLAEFEQFEIDRQVLAMEFLPATERALEVTRVQNLLREPDSQLELARALEGIGFHSSAIPVFRAEALRRARDYAPLQGMLDACNEALEPRPALEVVEQIRAGEFPAPPGLTAEYLAEQHARFLLHSRDLAALERLSRRPRAGDGAPPISSRSHIPYRAALIEAYRIQGRSDELLLVLEEDRTARTIEKRHLLLGAETFFAEGRHEEALEWIDDILAESSEPALERRAIRLGAEIHEASGWSRPDEMVRLVRHSLAEHPANLTREMAELVHEAGATQEAVAILKLLRRRTSEPGLRAGVASQLIRLEHSNGASWSDLAEEWEAYFRDFVYEIGNSADFLDSARTGASPANAGRFVERILPALDAEAATVLEAVPAPESSRWLRDLLIASLRGSLERDASALLSDADTPVRERILETLPSFGDSGIAVARLLVDGSRRRGTEFFLHQPYRQLLFYHRTGDRVRLLEVHANLMQEARSDQFHQTGQDRWVPHLTTRYRIPQLVAELGEADLALRLYRRYHEGVHRYRWHHAPFLENYLSFLLEEERLDEAESIARSVFVKTLRVDLRLLAELGHRSGRSDENESWLVPYSLSQGQRALLRDWSSALADGREMVEYSDSW